MDYAGGITDDGRVPDTQKYDTNLGMIPKPEEYKKIWNRLKMLTEIDALIWESRELEKKVVDIGELQQSTSSVGLSIS